MGRGNAGVLMGPTHSKKLTRADLDSPALALLLGGKPALLHAGVARGPRPGRALCNDLSMFQHPVFARDPNFGPGIPADERHLYALWALRLNEGSACKACIEQLVLTGGDGIYPYLNPTKAI